MADPTKPTPDKEKFKPQKVADAKGDSQNPDFGKRDLPRGSEAETRNVAQKRG